MRDPNPYDIFDVAFNILNIQILRDHDENKDVICPFCGNKTIGKTNICRTKNGKEINGFNCFGCGEHHNQYSLYAKLMGTTAKDGLTPTQIARKEIIEHFEGKKGDKPVMKYMSTPSKPSVNKRPDEELDVVYNALLKELSLKDIHKQDLLRRGLSLEQIAQYKYRSVGTDIDDLALCRRLQSKGHNLKGIPGFYQNKYGDFQLKIYKLDGYLCPVYSIKGFLIGFQIRLDHPKDGQKYIWLSSTNKNNGVSSGSPCSYFGPKNCEKVLIVDGILKANIVYELLHSESVGVIGSPGVSNYKNIYPMIESVKKDIGVKILYNAFDMDEYTSPICRHDNKHCFNCDYYMENYHRANCSYMEKKLKMLKDGSSKLKEMCSELKLEYKRST